MRSMGGCRGSRPWPTRSRLLDLLRRHCRRRRRWCEPAANSRPVDAASREKDERQSGEADDSAGKQGEVLEAIGEAVRSELPVLFFIEDNAYAISTRTRQKTFFSLPQSCGAAADRFYGLPIHRLNGRDVARCAPRVESIVDEIRRTRCPAIIVFDGIFLVSFARAFQLFLQHKPHYREWMIRAIAVLLGIATTRPIMGVFFATMRLTHLEPRQFFGMVEQNLPAAEQDFRPLRDGRSRPAGKRVAGPCDRLRNFRRCATGRQGQHSAGCWIADLGGRRCVAGTKVPANEVGDSIGDGRCGRQHR